MFGGGRSKWAIRVEYVLRSHPKNIYTPARGLNTRLKFGVGMRVGEIQT